MSFMLILNSKTNEEMEALAIRDKTKIIMEETKLITKKEMAQLVQTRPSSWPKMLILSNPFSKTTSVKVFRPIGMETNTFI